MVNCFWHSIDNDDQSLDLQHVTDGQGKTVEDYKVAPHGNGYFLTMVVMMMRRREKIS